ncbi:MAG: TetR family transcriptional regulator [Magnetococcus sp. DMHC-1]
MHADDKVKRREALLDAAETLWIADSGRGLRIEDVARAAGVAKGTVYLYFPGKEELLLAVHTRHIDHFFTKLCDACGREQRLTLDELLELTMEHLVKVPGFLPMSNLCSGLLESGVPVDTALHFKRHVAGWLQRAGTLMQAHFPLLTMERGAVLLMHSYALIIGLWQLLHPSRLHAPGCGDAMLGLVDRDYDTELRFALRALWVGELSEAVH